MVGGGSGCGDGGVVSTGGRLQIMITLTPGLAKRGGGGVTPHTSLGNFCLPKRNC